jgi:hypothetical protein
MNKQELEQYLRQTHADQGGEASFEVWLEYVSNNDDEFAHEEAAQFIGMK